MPPSAGIDSVFITVEELRLKLIGRPAGTTSSLTEAMPCSG